MSHLPPLAELSRRIRDRELSSEQLTRSLLDRIEALNPDINAIVAQDPEATLAQACEADRQLRDGRLQGPLHGIPMTVKDAFETRDFVSACGVEALAGHRAPTNAAAVERLTDAGAIILGKTNTPPFCGDFQSYNPVYGVTGNPWDLSRSPGGSSGGAAAALAAGLTPAELGSDIGGSIRNPAHFCGVYGHKPSYGLIPMRGHIPGPPGTLSRADLSVAGPLARHAEDLALLLELLTEPPPGRGYSGSGLVDEQRGISDLRIRLWIDDPACPVSAEIQARYLELAERLRTAGATVLDGPPNGMSLQPQYDMYMRLLAAIVGGGSPKKLYKKMRWPAHWARFSGRDAPDTLPGYALAATMSHRDWLQLNEARCRVHRQWDQAFNACDLLLMPVTPTTALKHQHAGNLFSRRIRVDGEIRPYADHMAWISPPTLADLPATVAPTGMIAGLPVGIQIVAPRYQDLRAIRFAAQLAKLMPPPVWEPLA